MTSKTLAFEAVRDQIASLARRRDLTEDQRVAIVNAVGEICRGMTGLPVVDEPIKAGRRCLRCGAGPEWQT